MDNKYFLSGWRKITGKRQKTGKNTLYSLHKTGQDFLDIMQN